MSPLTILTDQDVRVLLHSLTKKDILSIQQSLADALHYYSTAVEADDNGCSASHQPERTHLSRKDGSTTLFMPASSTDGMGVKIVTLSEVCARSADPPPRREDSVSSISSSGRSSITESSQGNTGSISSGLSNISLTSKSSTSHTTAFDVPPDITPEMMEAKMRGAATSPSGSLTLLNTDGSMRGLINAAEITAFRTALASTMLFKKRANVHDVVVFGIWFPIVPHGLQCTDNMGI